MKANVWMPFLTITSVILGASMSLTLSSTPAWCALAATPRANHGMPKRDGAHRAKRVAETAAATGVGVRGRFSRERLKEFKKWVLRSNPTRAEGMAKAEQLPFRTERLQAREWWHAREEINFRCAHEAPAEEACSQAFQP